MNTILIAVTAVSLAMAAGMGAMLWRTLRLERRRSAARVELLEEMVAGRQHETAARTSSLGDFELRPGGPQGAADVHIFQEHQAPSAWPRRLAVAGGMAAVVCAVFLGWRGLGSPAPSNTQAPGQGRASEIAQPLELLSLQHAQQSGALVISGLVQNPRGSAPLANVQATVMLFGADGSTLATSRAPLDFTTLGPGDESSFVIRVPSGAAVARYRVGFRTAHDTVLHHVDRRNTETVAQRQAP